MGLDMYLKAQRYVNKNDYNAEPPAVLPEYAKLAALYPEMDNGLIYGFEVSRTVAYWRKANQIHRWFVENVQQGEDDCQDHYVERDQLVELLDLCKQVKQTKEMAAVELPPQPGFFFGSTEVDDWYWQDIDSTIDQLTAILNDKRLDGYDFYYTSSW